MLDRVSRRWRRLLGKYSPSKHQHTSPIEDGGLKALPPPPGFTPQEAEVIHSQAVASGSDDSHDLDLSEGILLVTNRAVVFFTRRKRWRIPWRTIVQAGIKRGGTLQVETNGGKSFSFVMPSRSEAEMTGATVVAVRGAH